MNIFHIQAECWKVESKPHSSVRVTFDSQENLSDDDKARIMGWHEKTGHLTFLMEAPVQAMEVLELPALVKKQGEKSPSQRLREVIYLLGRQKNVADDEAFYRVTMELIINQVKEKLT